MNKPKVLCFGELLYRIQNTGKLFSHNQSEVALFPGGSEANVAVATAQLGIDTLYMSSGPNNILVDSILASMKDLAVDISKFRFEGDRLGSYILLGANGLTTGEVVYDRKYSAFSLLKHNDIDWATIFEGIDWFHWTALTPALSQEHVELCKRALIEAKKRNLTVSVDLNYRNRLWQYGKSPVEVMPDLISQCDVIMGNIWASNKMLGTYLDDKWNGDRSALDYPTISEIVADEVFTKYPQCKHLAFTFRFMNNASHNLFYGTYHTDQGHYVSNTFETNNVIDRIGSGDAFMGGLIAALIKKYSPQDIVNYATEIGYKKLFVKGDFIKI